MYDRSLVKDVRQKTRVGSRHTSTRNYKAHIFIKPPQPPNTKHPASLNQTQQPNMSHSILLTGTSGYLGGTFLTHLHRISLPPHATLYALVRSESQASAVTSYGATPLFLDLADSAAVLKTVTKLQISIVYFLVDALNSTLQGPLITALGQVKKQTGRNVHFVHTSGAKMFSAHAGMPVGREVRDTEEELFEMQKSVKAPYEIMNQVCLVGFGGTIYAMRDINVKRRP